MEFQQRDRQNSQNSNNDTFSRRVVTISQCIYVTEKHLDGGTILSYADHDYSQSFNQTKEAFRALTREDLVQPYKSVYDFRSPSHGIDAGNNFYVFEICYQKYLRLHNQ